MAARYMLLLALSTSMLMMFSFLQGLRGSNSVYSIAMQPVYGRRCCSSAPAISCKLQTLMSHCPLLLLLLLLLQVTVAAS
jgi:hypothetical protein